MNADDTYQWLIDASGQSVEDSFDIHVVASILALAMAETAANGTSLAAHAGLGRSDVSALAQRMFAPAAGELEALTRDLEPDLDEEEQSVRDILLMYASGESTLERPLAAMIARRCREPNHLWQDLGLRGRGELSLLIQRHFAPLKARNSGDMKWKKFLYRMVCSTEGFSLCTAPVCTECDDFENCFGVEDGEAMLARIGNGREAVA